MSYRSSECTDDDFDDDSSSVRSFHSCFLPDDEDLEAMSLAKKKAVEGTNYSEITGEQDLDSSVEEVPATKLPIPRLPSSTQISPPPRVIAKSLVGTATVEPRNETTKTVQKKNRRIVLDDDDSCSESGGEEAVPLAVATLKQTETSSSVQYLSGDDNTDEEDDDKAVPQSTVRPAQREEELKKRLAPKYTFDFDIEGDDEDASETENQVVRENVTIAKAERTRFVKHATKGYWYLDSATTDSSWTRLPQEIGDFLYDYQREGVEFLLHVWSTECGGGILADDMGMGKTNQAVAALASLFYSTKAKRAIVVVPLSVMDRWRSLLVQWVQPYTQGGGVHLFHGPRKDVALKNVAGDRGGVLLTTYETCQSNVETLSRTRWDCLIADEASKIKNHKAGLSKAMRQLASVSRRRVCLTGTPFENSLAELWALFDFACDGQLLGSFEAFNRHFAGRIERSQFVGREGSDVVVGTQLSKALHAVIAPYLLRREKSMFFGTKQADGSEKATVQQPSQSSPLRLSEGIDTQKENSLEGSGVQPKSQQELAKDDATIIVLQPEARSGTQKLPEFKVRKVDVLVWVNLSACQRQLYRSFLESDEVALALNKTQSPLAAITVLKKICDDPHLVNDRRHVTAGGSGGGGGKLQVLMTLLHELALNGGHKVIVFSHSKRMIDFMEQAVQQRRRREQTLACLRVDGDIKAPDRVKLIRSFNRDELTGDKTKDDWFDGKWDVLFLTSGVGALGIEVTGADRVIVFDPHWNPAVDDQAIDRAFRIGQKKNVVCYRFVTVGTVEETMTRIQLRKTSLARTILNAETQRAYSSLDDLRALFTLGEADSDDRLHRVIARSSGTVSIEDSVRDTLKDCGKPSEIAEVIAQLNALSSTAADQGDEDDEGALSLRKLVKDGIVAGVSDRAGLFGRNDDELEASLRGMSIDDKKAVSKVVEDAMGWLMTKESA